MDYINKEQQSNRRKTNLRRYKVMQLKETLIETGEYFSKHLSRLTEKDSAENENGSYSPLDKLVNEIKSIDDANTTVESMLQFTKRVTDEAKSQASMQTITFLSQSGWGEVYDMRDVVLWAITASGEVNEEEVTLYQSDDEAWKNELFYIWDVIHENENTVA